MTTIRDRKWELERQTFINRDCQEKRKLNKIFFCFQTRKSSGVTINLSSSHITISLFQFTRINCNPTPPSVCYCPTFPSFSSTISNFPTPDHQIERRLRKRERKKIRAGSDSLQSIDYSCLPTFPPIYSQLNISPYQSLLVCGSKFHSYV